MASGSCRSDSISPLSPPSYRSHAASTPPHWVLSLQLVNLEGTDPIQTMVPPILVKRTWKRVAWTAKDPQCPPLGFLQSLGEQHLPRQSRPQARHLRIKCADTSTFSPSLSTTNMTHVPTWFSPSTPLF